MTEQTDTTDNQLDDDTRVGVSTTEQTAKRATITDKIDRETGRPSENTPTSVGTALAMAKKLRDEGKGDEADALLESIFARATSEKEEAKRQATIATENLRRAVQKKDRHVRTHAPKTMPRPSEDPIYLREYRGRTLTPEIITSLARFGSSEMGVDCGPPRNGYRGVPQRGSCGGPAVTFADWIEQEIALTPGDLPGAADRAAARIERKLDALMIVGKEYEQRAWRIAALLVEIDRHGGDVERASAAVLRYRWPAVYDAEAVGAENTSGTTPSAPDDANTSAEASIARENDQRADDSPIGEDSEPAIVAEFTETGIGGAGVAASAEAI